MRSIQPAVSETRTSLLQPVLLDLGDEARRLLPFLDGLPRHAEM